MTDDEKIAAVQDHLAKLGELAPDEIARLFADLGITGWCQQSDACPVSNYVLAETGQHVRITSNRWVASAYWTDWTADAPVSGTTPATVSQFIVDFDAGLHPELRQQR